MKNLSDNAGPSQVPAIAVSDNYVHVVWVDSTSGNVDILYRRSMDGGIAFTDPIKNLSSNTGFSSEPAISLSSNNIYVVWEDAEMTSPATEIVEDIFRQWSYFSFFAH